MKTKKTVCITLFALLVLWSCNEENAETPPLANNELPENAIGFSVLQNIGGELPTRADITADNLSLITVYAHYTGTGIFTTSSTPNLMSGVAVTKTSGSTWEYSPLKYWPGDNQKVSFFAIAPEPVPTNGIALKTSGDSYAGYPGFTVTTAENPSEQKDIVVASAVDRTKGEGASVALIFNHVMAKVDFSASYKGALSGNGYVKIKHLWVTKVTTGTFQLTSGGFNWDAPSSGDLTYYHFSAENGNLNDAPLPASSSGSINLLYNTLMLAPQTNATVQLIATVYNGSFEKDYGITATLPLNKTGERVTHHLEIDLDKSRTPTGQWDYAYNTASTVGSGATATFTAPETGYYLLEAWGAGGSKGYENTGSPASGGYSKGSIFLKKDQKIYVYVGGYTSNSWGDGSTTNTFNGGGRNYQQTPNNENAWLSGIGGGATDFRLKAGTWNDAKSLNSRILVAGGGGGAASHKPAGGTNANGGAGGGLTGGDGYSAGTNAGSYNSKGGSQIKGGDKTNMPNPDSSPQDGSFGTGGGVRICDGGGGGGYYGGGAGSHTYVTAAILVGGGGGSSFISGMTGCKAINPSSTTEPREPDLAGNIAALNYSNTDFGDVSPTWTEGADIAFTNIAMIDGAGYEWNTGTGTKASASTGMPDYTSGAVVTGNTGDGHARITLLIVQ